jgi:hypothetical protein
MKAATRNETFVLDENKQPLLLYRVLRGRVHGKAIYLTRHRSFAESYAEGKTIVAAYARIKKPKEMRKRNTDYVGLTNKDVEKLMTQGYDGIIYNKGDVVVVFSDEQLRVVETAAH